MPIRETKNLTPSFIGYTLSTVNFGTFEVISWEGEWSAIRHIIVKVSSKLNMKIIEGWISFQIQYFRIVSWAW